MRLSRWVLLLGTLLLFTGCTSHYVPKATTFELEKTPDFYFERTIALINAQATKEDVDFVGSAITTNLSGWTDAAIEITRSTLVERGLTVDAAASKTLALSVEGVTGACGMWVCSSDATLHVKTGDGYAQRYSAHNKSPSTVFRSADGTVMKLVAEMLRDEKIINYISD